VDQVVRAKPLPLSLATGRREAIPENRVAHAAPREKGTAAVVTRITVIGVATTVAVSSKATEVTVVGTTGSGTTGEGRTITGRQEGGMKIVVTGIADIALLPNQDNAMVMVVEITKAVAEVDIKNRAGTMSKGVSNLAPIKIWCSDNIKEVPVGTQIASLVAVGVVVIVGVIVVVIATTWPQDVIEVGLMRDNDNILIR
jgi:hypothetical protein